MLDQPEDTVLVDSLRVFLHKHLLHWIECLSVLGKLQTGVKSLGDTATVLSVSYSPERGRKHCETNHFLIDRTRNSMTYRYLFTTPAGLYK